MCFVRGSSRRRGRHAASGSDPDRPRAWSRSRSRRRLPRSARTQSRASQRTCGQRVEDRCAAGPGGRGLYRLRHVIAFAAVSGVDTEARRGPRRDSRGQRSARRAPRLRAMAMLGALLLAPVLLLADIWHSPQLSTVHRHPLVAAVAGLIAVVVVGADRVRDRPPAGAARSVARARAPVSGPDRGRRQRPRTCSSRSTSSSPRGRSSSDRPRTRRPGFRSRRRTASRGARRRTASRGSAAGRAPEERVAGAPGWVERLLALYVVLYAVQSLYSTDFEKALQQMVFFYVPFTLLFCLLREIAVDRAARPHLPVHGRRAGAPVRCRRVRRVRDEDDLPEPEADRRQRRPPLLHGQLGVLRPGHLRAVPRARDDRGRRAPPARPRRRATRSARPSSSRSYGPRSC